MNNFLVDSKIFDSIEEIVNKMPDWAFTTPAQIILGNNFPHDLARQSHVDGWVKITEDEAKNAKGGYIHILVKKGGEIASLYGNCHHTPRIRCSFHIYPKGK